MLFISNSNIWHIICVIQVFGDVFSSVTALLRLNLNPKLTIKLPWYNHIATFTYKVDAGDVKDAH